MNFRWQDSPLGKACQSVLIADTRELSWMRASTDQAHRSAPIKFLKANRQMWIVAVPCFALYLSIFLLLVTSSKNAPSSDARSP